MLNTSDDIILIRKSKGHNHNRIEKDLSHDQGEAGTRLVNNHIHFKANLYQATNA